MTHKLGTAGKDSGFKSQDGYIVTFLEIDTTVISQCMHYFTMMKRFASTQIHKEKTTFISLMEPQSLQNICFNNQSNTVYKTTTMTVSGNFVSFRVTVQRELQILVVDFCT